jgi:glycolate oxidase
MTDLTAALAAIVGDDHVLTGDAIGDDYGHDEALTATAVRPRWVTRPATTAEVAAIVTLAHDHGVPVTGRGSGTGLSGACIPCADGLVVSFERMAAIVEIDLENFVAVVQPGVTLDELDAATAAHGLVYPVFPGESSASLGGNVATNAGGMRAVKYGVTRHHVLGLEAVLGTGEVIRTGGKFVKSSTGYDLTQLVIGSEGTLALTTEVILKLYPRPAHAATVLAPFSTLAEVTAAVPKIVGSGIGPLIIEYIDLVSMAGILDNAGLDLGIPAEVKDAALAYLVLVLEDHRLERLDEDIEQLAQHVAELGALDVYVLPPHAGAALIDAREKAFWAAKANNADDILDMVVPRAQIPEYLAAVGELAAASGSFVVGCGHAGDGNVHLSVFQGDAETRARVIHDIFAAGLALGGAISGEHGIGSEKKAYLLELEDPAKLALMARIKAAFDPRGILNPGTIFDA